MLVAIILGFAFGWIGSIPVAGPIAAVVVTRGLQGRFRSAVMVAVGGAVIEAGYACLAFWGFSTLLKDYPLVDPISRGLAAVILAGLGIMFLRGVARSNSQSTKATPTRNDHSDWASIAVGASICALNPTLIATWTAVVTTLHGGGFVDVHGRQAIPFALGVMCGIGGWFVALLAIIERYRQRFSDLVLARTVRVVGAGLLLLSGWFAVRFVLYFRLFA
jgi:threonine/homoserine/homoserine lactone efflux protein